MKVDRYALSHALNTLNIKDEQFLPSYQREEHEWGIAIVFDSATALVQTSLRAGQLVDPSVLSSLVAVLQVLLDGDVAIAYFPGVTVIEPLPEPVTGADDRDAPQTEDATPENVTAG